MTADPRLLIPLSDLPGLDPVGLRVLVDGEPRICLTFESCRHPWMPVLAISLADAATRDRVLRWLAPRVGLEVGCGAPGWVQWAGAHAWDLVGTKDPTPQVTSSAVPALAALDITDDTRLPDGSRWVDAIALAAVARHVGAQ